MPNDSLSARQEDRRPLALRAEFEVSQAHREQVRYSPSSNAPQPHSVAGSSLDISSAGIGLLCDNFVPRMTEGMVRVFAPSSNGEQTQVFEHAAKVRRVSLRIADKPAYMLGLAFTKPQPGLDAKIAELIRRFGTEAGPRAGRQEAAHA